MALESCGERRAPAAPRDFSSECTHITLARLYLDDKVDQKCSICKKTPAIGWLYRCTEDYHGLLPTSDFSKTETTKRVERDADLYTLSPSVTEAAASGHYTQEELARLWRQKIEVRKLVQRIRPTTSSSASTRTNSSYSIAASTSYSTFPSSESDTDLENDPVQRVDCFPMYRGFLETIHEVHDDLEKDEPILPFARATIPTVCNFKVCHNCRYQTKNKEKAWASIDAVLKIPYRHLAPSIQEFQNKRLSNTNVVKSLGAKIGLANSEDSGADLLHIDSSRHSRTQFQDTVQRLLRGQLPECVTYSHNDLTGDGRPQGLSRQIRYANLAAIGTPATSQTGSLSNPSFADSSFFNNGNATFSTMDTSGLVDDDECSTSSSGPRPIYRHGYERTTSINMPTRADVSYYGERSSPRAASANQSVLSHPSALEEESLEQGGREKLWTFYESADRVAEFLPIPKMAMDGSSDGSRPPNSLRECVSNRCNDFRWTPKSKSRFFIE